MNNKNMLVKFFVELIKRYGQKSPKFFRIIGIVASLCAAVSGIPEVISWFTDTPPDWVITLQNKLVAIASIVGALVAFASVETPAVAQAESGELVKVSNESALPFSTAVEKKAADKQDLPPAETIK